MLKSDATVFSRLLLNYSIILSKFFRNKLNMSTSRLLELASIISDKTKEVDTYIHDNGLPPPSFDPSYPPVLDLQGDVGAARAAALEAIEELKAHLLGPVGKIYEDAVHASFQ